MKMLQTCAELLHDDFVIFFIEITALPLVQQIVTFQFEIP